MTFRTHFIITILLLVSAISYGQNKLQLNLNVGDVYTMDTKSTMSITQTLSGEEIENEVILRGSMTFKVNSFSDNIYDMEVRYKRMYYNMKTPLVTITMDSHAIDEEQDKFQELLNSLASSIMDKPFTVRMNVLGKIDTIIGYDKMIFLGFTSAANSESFTDEQKIKFSSVVTNVYKYFGSKSIKGEFERMFNIYTENDIQKSGTWTATISLQGASNSIYIVKYTLDHVSEDGIYLTSNGQLSTSKTGDGIEMSGYKMKYDMDGTYTSTYKLDPKTMWIIEANITHENEGVVHIEKNDDLPEGMTIPMTTKGVTIFKSE